MTLSPDRSMCVYTACDRPNSLGSCDLYIRFFTNNNGWSREYNLGSEINSKYWETQPCFSSDGKYLYFVSNRPEGFGGKDIWRCQIFAREFTNLVNLGSNINTKYNDMNDKIIANTKKFCGFKINIWGWKKEDDTPSVLGEEAFAVGSIDPVYSDDDVTRRVNESAIEHLSLYIDWIKKKIKY